MHLAYLPSPSQGVWHLGPFPLRAYALCLIVGIFAAVWLTGGRWSARGGDRDEAADIAVWAVPFGLVGGRLYHVATDPELYFAAGQRPIRALYVWEGGLGIPGAVALGAVGAWLGCRRRGIRLADFADAAAPGLVLAQAIGRWGNYFNQELYGRPADVPWKLLIDPSHRPADSPGLAFYHPAFLYESLWDLGVLALLLWLDRRRRREHGRLFGWYVLAYSAGRSWIEALRVDHANHFLGLRLNDWVSAALFLGAAGFLLATRRPRPSVPAGVPDLGTPTAGPDLVAAPDAREPAGTAGLATTPGMATSPGVDLDHGAGPGPGADPGPGDGELTEQQL